MVSILVTTYNSSKTLLPTLLALVNQTFTSFEIVIVDDGSSDDTVKLVRSVTDPRIRIFEPGKLGRAKALNFGVRLCLYNWIAICDSDDIWHPSKLELQWRYIEANPLFDVLATESLLFSHQEKIIFKKFSNPFNISLKRMTLRIMMLSNKISHSSVLIRKNLASYSETRSSQLDYELWLRLLYAKNFQVYILCAPLTYHRIHANQSFESKGILYRIKSIFLVNHFAIKSFSFLIFFFNIFKLPFYILSRLRIVLKARIFF